jgi:hypothetical protein
MPRRPAYDFGVYDVAVDDALRHGVTPQLTLTGPAPAWATRDHRVGVMAPDARRFARFAAAAADHFAGRVKRWSIWNEPNWFSLLQPVTSAPFVYRDLFRGAAHAIHHVDPRAKVLLGELAPMGRPGLSVPPLAFLRSVTCRDGALRPLRRCVGLEADGVALHPYTLRYPATFPGPSPDDVTTGSLPRLVKALRDLRRVRALRTPAGGAPPIYLTEYGFLAKTGPIPMPLAARYLRDGLQLAYRIPQVRQVILYEVAGARERRPRWDSALLDFRGRPRPLYRAAVGGARAHLPAP